MCFAGIRKRVLPEVDAKEGFLGAAFVAFRITYMGADWLCVA